jgi:2-polyprenyl-3-methyl-5-hydroxy-6-metoxy-1,4-benzoquinol methylase
MTLWEERISAASEELLLAEHESRYRFVRPLVASAGSWCDIGCGTAAASVRALGDVLPPDVLLVDAAQEALDSATLALTGAQAMRVDLTTGADVDQLRSRIFELRQPVVVTCFEVIEHVSTLNHLIGLFAQLVSGGVDLCLSVPNDIFTGVDNPFHVTKWGPESLAELQSVIPAQPVRANQFSLSGSMVVPEDRSTADGPLPQPDLGAEPPAPVQQLLLYSERGVPGEANVVCTVTDNVASRAWERQREADLAYFRSRADASEALTAQVAELSARIAQIESEQ